MLARWDVLRIVSLVSAGVASGYLWRAALEKPGLDAVPPLRFTAEPVPDWIPPVATRTFERVVTEHRHVFRHKQRAPARKPTGPATERTDLAAGDSGVTAAAPPTAAPLPPAPAKPSPRKPPRKAKPPKTERPTPPAPPAPPSPPPPASPPAPPAAPTSPLPAPIGEASAGRPDRPGWGKGDKNHDHTGPPGRGKR